MFEFITRAIQARLPRKTKEAAPLSAIMLTLEEMKALIDQAKQQELADAHAAAASGEGPQSWDADWFEFQAYIEDDIKEIALTIGWQRSQYILEALDWALASPEGQRAIAEIGNEPSPRQGALQMLQELRRPLIEASREMLLIQANGLGLSCEAQEALSEYLDELPGTRHNITRTEG